MSRQKRAVLAVGASGRFHGIYHPHWEWPRFEVRLEATSDTAARCDGVCACADGSPSIH
jgi:hypothetical protein